VWGEFNSSLGGSFYPTANNAAAGKQHRMFAARVDNSQFQITVEWRADISCCHIDFLRKKAHGMHKPAVQPRLVICRRKFDF